MYGDERFIGDVLVRDKGMPAAKFPLADGGYAIATAWHKPMSSVLYWRAMVNGVVYGPYATMSALRERIDEDIRRGWEDARQGSHT